MSGSNRRRGFTLVELSLSMIFISILSLAVVLVITGAISSYHKSITMNQVDTVGMSLVDDLRLSIQQSPVTKLENLCHTVYGGKSGESNCDSDGARGLVSVARRASVSRGGENLGEMPVFGALCTGEYSYIWNSGYFFNSDYTVGSSLSPASLKYNRRDGGSGLTAEKFKLLKVKDENRAVCVAAVRVRSGRAKASYSKNDIGSEFNIAVSGLIGDDGVLVDEDPVELISGGSDGLALYDLTTTVSEQGSGVPKNIFYYSSFILGTVQGGININAAGSFCVAPKEDGSVEGNFDYCAINKFNFAAMANGKWR